MPQVMQHLDSEGCARVAKLLSDMINSHETSFTTALVILQTAVGEELGDNFDQVWGVLARRRSRIRMHISVSMLT
jgi:hypothetical protein